MASSCSKLPINFADMRKNYRFGEPDKQSLHLIAPLMHDCAEEFIERIQAFIATFEDFSKYLPNDKILEEHSLSLKKWFMSLFDAEYDDMHLSMLFNIGLKHLQAGLPPHYVHATISFVRDFINEKISQHFDDRRQRDDIRSSCSKMLDLNLDVIASSYREAELRPYLVSGNFQRWLISFMEKYTFSMDVVLSFALMLISMLLMGNIVMQMYNFLDGKLLAEATAMDVLGTLLILWAISELMQEGIKHLRGASFGIASFVALGLAASIREILIASLNHEVNTIAVLTLTVLALGAVYYMLEKLRRSNNV